MTQLLHQGLRAQARASHLAFTVYTRSGCCLCDRAIDLIRSHQEHHGFTIELVDVDADPELAQRYGCCVPVVAVGGKVRFRGIINPALLERLLRAEAERTDVEER
jgi:glutaredoxin